MPFALILIGFFSLSSCAYFEKNKKKLSAKEYYEKALLYKKRGKLNKALNSLQELEKNFSYDSRNLSASLMIADIHFEQKDYEKALKYYKLFKKFYPTRKSLYVHYQLGRSHFYQLPSSPDRDLSKADLALKNLQAVLKSNSPYKKEAKKYIQKIKNLKAEKDFQAVLFYLKKDWNQAAFKRLQTLLKEYPKSPFVPKALLYSYRLAKKRNKKSAGGFKNRLHKEFPNSKEAQSL